LYNLFGGGTWEVVVLAQPALDNCLLLPPGRDDGLRVGGVGGTQVEVMCGIVYHDADQCRSRRLEHPTSRPRVQLAVTADTKVNKQVKVRIALYGLEIGNSFPDLFFHSREFGNERIHSRDSRAPGNDV